MTTAQPEPVDRVIFRSELQTSLAVTSETIRRYLKLGKLPPPDIDQSRKKQGWRLSTLQRHGIGVL